MPLFSVVIPTYNRLAYLRRAVASVLPQTLDDFELLVVDDCSPKDPAPELADITDPRLRLLRRSKNGGPAATRNTGIQAAQGRYVAFLDDDDEYMPEFLAQTWACWQSASIETGLSWSGTCVVRDVNGQTTVVEKGVWSPRYPSRDAAYRAFLRSRRIGTCGLVVRRDAFDEIGLLDEALHKAEDTDLLIRLVRCFDFIVVPQVLVRIWDHAGPRAHHSAQAGADAYARIIAKHIATLETDPALWADLHYKAGWQYYHSGDKRQGRRYLLGALRRRPAYLKAWAALTLFELLGRRGAGIHRALSDSQTAARTATGDK
jgi:glycosyltransferase involved in cell wall biosynthesis